MTLRLSETIRRWMGWCPNADTNRFSRRYATLDDEIVTGTAKKSDREAVEGALVDYGLTGNPATYLILIVATALLIGCFFVTSPAGNLFLLVIILAFSGVELYGALRKARVEISSDTITIRRPLFRPIVIPKDAVEKAEVGEKKLPVPSWLLVAALAAIFVSAAGGIYSGWGDPTSMRFIFGLAAAIFFPVLFYRTYVRIRYLQVLVITTTKKRIAVIYTDDPKRIARVLGVAR
ncbi:hypothetical protein L21_1072 [Methanoculleus chikugoensis]|uniref:DUF1673 family protein n=1 Tax=Methanoculleus chikugoensis TaxID=118126 RepID=A0A1M4MK37_9EURY|nr:DUF1673 family protein [Methanoculleus chikugoensis]SCL75180.1 hypothetical protein L21_1072 [Methanoculleus chikugoensis]